MTYGNGLVESDSYSLDYEINRLLVQNGAASVQDNVCTRADNLNLTDAVTPANNQTFSYSPANRLATASGNYGVFGWTYDGVGNRTGQALYPRRQRLRLPHHLEPPLDHRRHGAQLRLRCRWQHFDRHPRRRAQCLHLQQRQPLEDRAPSPWSHHVPRYRCRCSAMARSKRPR
jgi:hypothetical protein